MEDVFSKTNIHRRHSTEKQNEIPNLAITLHSGHYLIPLKYYLKIELPILLLNTYDITGLEPKHEGYELRKEGKTEYFYEDSTS